YGGGHAGVDAVAGAPRWARDLNLDPRHRAAAAFGAEVVRRHQEALMASAWAQAAAVARANDALRQGQLARTAAAGAYRRLTGAGTRAAVGTARLLQVSAPAHGSLAATDALAANREVQAALSPAFRRLTRPGGPLARRVSPGQALEAPVADLASRALTVNPALAPAPGMVALESITTGDRIRDLTAARLRARWWESDPTTPGEVPVAATPRVLTVGGVMPNRVFLVTEDGRLLSRVDDPAAWHDHGRPPGGTATGPAVAMRDLHAFVATADGRLCSLQWDGDGWVWLDHGRPNNSNLTGRPLALARDAKPVGGGLVRTGNFQSVFVCAADGHLWERSGLESDWHWIDRGTPPGTTAVGAPGVTGPWDILVHAGDGRVFRFFEEGNGWQWSDWGRPGVTADPAVPPIGTDPAIFVRSTDGRIQIRYKMWFAVFWVTLAGPHHISNLVGFANGLWVTSEPTGRLMRWYTPPGGGDNTWDVHEPVAGLRSWGVIRNGAPWVAADGKVVVREGAPGAWTWRDHGLPAAGGTGDPAAAPPRRPQWRGQLGFMGNLLVASVEGSSNPDRASLVVGEDLGFEGEVRGGWQSVSAPVPVRNDDTQGAGLAITRLGRTGDTDPDVVLFWVAGTAQGNIGHWRIGGSVMPSGDIVGWDDTVRQMPTPMSTLFGSSGALTASYPVLGADLALADLDGDDRPEMVVAYVSGIPGRQLVYYRVGWRLDPAGAVAGGWTESIALPWPGREAGALPVKGVGVAVADVDGDLRPELVVLLVEQAPAGARASYMIGRQINARGRVVGGWSGPHPVGGDGIIGATAQGASIALVDFSGSQSPDLVVFHVEPSSTGPTRSWYRVGFDLQSSGVARRWSEPRQVAADWGAASQGAGIVVGDFDNALLARKRQFAADFRAAATPHQQLIERGQSLARADDEAGVAVEPVAAAVRSDLDPEQTVTARVTGSVRGVDFARLPAGADRLNPLAVAPTFPQPMFQPLAELSQELVLPGVEGVPADTVTLLRANPRFIESYMVGLNHELAREMLWREFPGDRQATFFRQFWDARIGDAGAGPLTDIAPLAAWDPDLGLGGNATAVGGPDMVVLLVRGELLRRYPSATVFARRAQWGSPEPEPRQLGTERLLAQFQGELAPDLV
ncbi:MAG TPA: hypothetical protein VFO65_05975, partial [Acidimicrobiales bacterium]|nr:hypothetical protein [Acidimicrobiales bacterium]